MILCKSGFQTWGAQLTEGGQGDFMHVSLALSLSELNNFAVS